ncbi:alpha/beta-hydrolase [Bimuria novae-zelandiae CBS 107.79]|uniref:Alpha/beta-hydrolase n=1 Tax=Bimuria novae-zelandiae CBS 107.79 TaxID=1447943 RepID=A0A6A5V6V2_9PLEO|nr:alpha/beta-hydrolase [Bimuria novae-zelandiae CBS 107.79]
MRFYDFVSRSLLSAAIFTHTVTTKPMAKPTATINGGVIAGTTTSIRSAPTTVNHVLGVPFADAEASACMYPRIRVVFAPYTPAPKEGRAVMVWIYGGGLYNGDASMAAYDGSHFAAFEDVIIVAANYRTNVFGFPSTPDLPLEERNLGFLDQRFALEWVRRNIYAFGGDSGKATVFDEQSVLRGVCAGGEDQGDSRTRGFVLLTHGQWEDVCCGSGGASERKSARAGADTQRDERRRRASHRIWHDKYHGVSLAALQRRAHTRDHRGCGEGISVGGKEYPTPFDALAAIATDSSFRCAAALVANDTAAAGTRSWRYIVNFPLPSPHLIFGFLEELRFI